MADSALVASVQRPYRAIARHYSELADREEQADRERMAKRVAQLKKERQEQQASVPKSRSAIVANDNLTVTPVDSDCATKPDGAAIR